jgi:hypothetical protein
VNALRVTLAAALLALTGPAFAASAGGSTESSLPSVKAAFAYNFVKLTAWPDARFASASASAPLQVCVIRGDLMEDPLRTSLAGKPAGARTIGVQTVASDDSFGGCHVLYLGSQIAPRYQTLMNRAVSKGVLVIDEGAQFSWPDGMIRLFAEQSRMRFELNLEALERAGLKVDPRLIRLARIATR